MDRQMESRQSDVRQVEGTHDEWFTSHRPSETSTREQTHHRDHSYDPPAELDSDDWNVSAWMSGSSDPDRSPGPGPGRRAHYSAPRDIAPRDMPARHGAPGDVPPGYTAREGGRVTSGSDHAAPEPGRAEYVTSQDGLTEDALLPPNRRAPRSGWRRTVHRWTGGRVNPGESAADERLASQVARIRQPIGSDYRIACLSLKGGVGKTTVTVGLGSTLASMRGDNVVAVDANPDFGTLAERVPQQTTSTVRDLLASRAHLTRYADVRAHTSQAPSRLEVLAGERDPAASEAFTEEDYRGVIDLLRVHYNLILTDCGTGIMHSAMNGVLSLAHSLVLVSSPAVDGARSAAATLDWLGLHGYSHLVERTVVVVSAHRPGATSVDMDELTRHFLSRCRALVVVPFDEHLAEGSIVDLDRLRPRTRRAFVELAAMVADDFPEESGRHSHSPRSGPVTGRPAAGRWDAG